MTRRSLRIIVSLLLIVSFVTVSCGGGRKKSYKWKRSGKWTISKYSVPKSDVKLVVNDRVKAWMRYFTGPGRARFGRYLQRSGRYEKLMKGILKQHDIPEDVFYIALIESGFTASATSHANAVGFWQFIGSTGRRFDLRQDPYVDERRDFHKATHAAARYMKYLYNMFGHWYLAFAAYNAGEGKMGRAIKKYGTKNFWKLSSPKRRYLRAETKDYVPKYIAATIIAKNPRKYGFKVDYHEEVDFEEAKVPSQTDFEIMAKCAKTNYETISILNPELKMGVTPPGEKNYKVRVPRGKASRFHKAIAKIPSRRRVSKDYTPPTPATHKVKKGESLSKIARKYKISTKKLMAANHIKNSRRLKIGQRLILPGRTSKKNAYRPSRSTSDRVEIASKSPVKTKRKLIKHKIKRGESVGGIAQKYGVKVADLKKWNRIRGNKIIAGRKLKIYSGDKVSSASTSTAVAANMTTKTITKNISYKVKSGDTLSKIARTNGSTVANLKKWNGLKGNTIRIGQSLIAGKKKVKIQVPVETAPAVLTAPTSEVAEKSTAPVKTKSKLIKHKIKRGESIGGIAEKYGVTVADLKKWNKMRSNRIIAGRKLKIYSNKTSSVPEMISTPSTVASAPTTPTTTTKTTTKSETYKIKGGDTLGGIANKHGVSVANLRAWNNIKGNNIRAGKTLIVSKKKVTTKTTIPATTVAAKSPTPVSAKKYTKPTTTYKVKSGDTFYAIALRNNMTISELTAVNNMSRKALLKPGMKLKVRAPSSHAEKSTVSDRMALNTPAPVSTSGNSLVKYKVRKGDTAWGIAKKHNVSVKDLKNWNSSKDIKKIKPGDVIKVKVASRKKL